MKVVSDDILMKQIVIKLLVNCVLNSLTGLFQVKNGAILEIQCISPIIQDLVLESWPVIQIFMDGMKPIDLMELIIQVASKTSQNNNSMQLDIALGRESENDYILGYLINAAKRQGIDLPKFQILYHLVNSKAEIIKKFKTLDQ